MGEAEVSVDLHGCVGVDDLLVVRRKPPAEFLLQAELGRRIGEAFLSRAEHGEDGLQVIGHCLSKMLAGKNVHDSIDHISCPRLAGALVVMAWRWCSR